MCSLSNASAGRRLHFIELHLLRPCQGLRGSCVIIVSVPASTSTTLYQPWLDHKRTGTWAAAAKIAFVTSLPNPGEGRLWSDAVNYTAFTPKPFKGNESEKKLSNGWDILKRIQPFEKLRVGPNSSCLNCFWWIKQLNGFALSHETLRDYSRRFVIAFPSKTLIDARKPRLYNYMATGTKSWWVGRFLQYWHP